MAIPAASTREADASNTCDTLVEPTSYPSQPSVPPMLVQTMPPAPTCLVTSVSSAPACDVASCGTAKAEPIVTPMLPDPGCSDGGSNAVMAPGAGAVLYLLTAQDLVKLAVQGA